MEPGDHVCFPVPNPKTYGKYGKNHNCSDLFISAVPAFSRVLTPEEALERLLQSAPVRLKSKSSHLDAYDLIYTHSNGNRPFAYLFSSAQDGFMLVSADDNACPLLGYGDSELSKEAIPEHLIRWMEQYGNEIEMASGHENKRMRKTSSKRPHRQPIAPLCKTLWGMGYPYNEECPVFEGKHAETGGLATAMAQVMKYHNWPEREPEAIHTYARGKNFQ